jgi:hypothetical protein
VALLSAGLIGVGAVRSPSAFAFCVYPFTGPSCDECPTFENPCVPGPEPVEAPGGGELGGAPGEPPPPPPSEKANGAKNRAKRALENPGCNQFISGRQKASNDANTRLGEGKIVPNEHTNKNAPRDPDQLTTASVNRTLHGRGVGNIDLWKPFYDDARMQAQLDDEKQVLESIKDLIGGVNPIADWDINQWRAHILLHEIMHLDGTLPANHAWPGGEDVLVADIAKACPIPKN